MLSRAGFWALVIVASTSWSGCSPAKPEFTPRAERAELIPDAQDYMDQLMEQHFGTPTEMVAWERWPIHYHAAAGAVGAEPAADRLTINISEQWLEIEPGQEVTLLSGAVLDAAKSASTASPPTLIEPSLITAYDPATGVAVVDPPLPAAPAEGDRVVVGPGLVLQHGRMLYAEHCQHCHGVSGDGNGPTAQYLKPRPRDYRLGIFKFTSTNSSRRAQRDDLARIIDQGIPGTYMPSFKLLTEDESAAIVEYVMWLAMRGQTEATRTQILSLDFSQDALDDALAAGESELEFRHGFVSAWEEQFAVDFDDETRIIAESWIQSQDESQLIVPKTPRTPSSPESIANGRKLFLDPNAKCSTCHGESGLGDGAQTMLVQKDKEGRDRELPGLYDDWGNSIQPRNLTTGIYRGGRRPIDLYRRIHSGIKGTPMTGFGTNLTDAQIWDLVNYVLSIPFEQREPGAGPFVPAEPAETPVAAAATEATGQ